MLFPSIFSAKGLMNDSMDDMESALHSSLSMLKEMGGGIVADMRTDIKETEDSYELIMNLAGVKKEDIEATISDGYLTINVSHTEDKEDKAEKYLRKERYVGSMSRNFYVGDEVKETDISAKFDNGVLTLKIPKIKPTKPEVEKKTINIE